MLEIYIDSRGWLYKVGTSLSGNKWKVFYSKNNGKSWHSVRACQWFNSVDAAAQDLKAYAAKKDMKLKKTV